MQEGDRMWEQGWDRGIKSPAKLTQAFPASFVGEHQPGFKKQDGAEAGA